MATSALTHILANIKFNIPPQLLHIVFGKSAKNIDSAIIERVVKGKVQLDCNLHAGKITRIPLQEKWLIDTLSTPLDPFTAAGARSGIYAIPPHARENRDIVQVITLEYPSTYSGYPDFANTYGISQNTVSSLMRANLDSRTYGNTPTLPQLALMDGNMIRMTPGDSLIVPYVLVCLLDYDLEYVNIGSGGIKALQDLCLCATKIYMYNTDRITLDEAALAGGMQLGQITAQLDKYENEAEKYQELLATFAGHMAFDPQYTRYFISAQL